MRKWCRCNTESPFVLLLLLPSERCCPACVGDGTREGVAVDSAESIGNSFCDRYDCVGYSTTVECVRGRSAGSIISIMLGRFAGGPNATGCTEIVIGAAAAESDVRPADG